MELSPTTPKFVILIARDPLYSTIQRKRRTSRAPSTQRLDVYAMFMRRPFRSRVRSHLRPGSTQHPGSRARAHSGKGAEPERIAAGCAAQATRVLPELLARGVAQRGQLQLSIHVIAEVYVHIGRRSVWLRHTTTCRVANVEYTRTR
jgi:hypothetical protein